MGRKRERLDFKLIIDRTITAGQNSSSISIVTDKTTYEKNEKILVSFSGITNKDSWIGLYSATTTSYNPCSIGMWCYTATGTQWGIANSSNIVNSGVVTLEAEYRDVYTGYIPEVIEPGNYKIVLFGDNEHTNVLAVKTIIIQ